MTLGLYIRQVMFRKWALHDLVIYTAQVMLLATFFGP
jgi:hypothetical protein